MFPDAPVFTSVYDAQAMGSFWRGVDVRTSFMQKLTPRLGSAKALLPLYPVAFEGFDLAGFDLVLSSSSTFAKGVITRPETCHVCYCYTPTRFAWMYHEYTGRQSLPPGSRLVLPLVVAPLRTWDFVAAQRPDQMIGISRAVVARIRKYYRREAAVVEPPVDVAAFHPADSVDDYFLVVARLVAYKRIDLAVQACTSLGVRLRVVGDGPELAKLKREAGSTVEFLGRLEDEEVRGLMARCRALLWPGEEDFGLAPVEAQAAGRPVIAYGAGGALETVTDGETGILFRPQNVDALMDAIRNFDDARFDRRALRKNAERFDTRNFVGRMTAQLEAAVAAHRGQAG